MNNIILIILLLLVFTGILLPLLKRYESRARRFGGNVKLADSPSNTNTERAEGVVLGYEESCRYLQEQGLIESEAVPNLPAKMPRYDDAEPLGVEFFRTLLEDMNLGNLTLPRTFFARSEIRDTTFKNTNLSESNLCWNDFINVNFTSADLSNSDMRASVFEGVKFNNAILENADLRHSSFADCDFTGATLKGAKITKKVGRDLELSQEQQQDIDWQETDGDEPKAV